MKIFSIKGKTVVFKDGFLYKEDGKELHIWAASEIKAREHVGKADLILLGPQIRYLQKRISEMAPGKPVEVIDMILQEKYVR